MNSEHNFDNAFKEKLSQLDFEFQDAYWDEMEALLTAKKKKSGLLFWWITGLSVASVVLATTALLLHSGNSEVQTKSMLHNSKRSASTIDKTAEVNVIAEYDSQINKSSKAESATFEASNETQYAPANLQPKHAANQTSISKHAAANTTTVSNRINVGQSNSGKSELNSAQNKIERLPEFTPTIDENVQFNLESLIVLSPMTQEQNTNLDSEISSLANPNLETPHIRNWHSHVGVIGAANYGQSFKTTEGRVGGLGSQLGLRFYFAHRSGFQLNTGLSFGVNSIDGLVFEEKRKVFGFAQYDLVNTIYYKRMLTAHVPLYLGYEGYKFSVAGGLRLNYIMNTQGRVFTWDNTVVDQNIWGYAHGIKYFNLAAGLEASYRISRRFDLGMTLDFDLSSRSQENNDLISPEARLWQTGVFVKYRLN